MLLIFTSKRDTHVHRVTPHLDEAGMRWIRVNTEDFPSNCSLAIDPTTGLGELRVLDSNCHVELNEIEAVWYRKPDTFSLSHFELDPPSLEYVEAEFTEILHGIYALLRNARWINDPLVSRIAHRKMLQLRVAKEIGFRVPRSIVTNRVEEALSFAAEVNWDVAVKSLGTVSVTTHAGETSTQYGVFTRRITQDEMLRTAKKIPNMPTLFQEYVHKETELRVTCVGDEVFCCKIHSQEGALTKEDMRFETRTLRHELIYNEDVERMATQYLKAFDLSFGCFDIAILASGEPVFFECNPNGQWLWIEELTGAPIGRAIAQLFLSSRPEGKTATRSKQSIIQAMHRSPTFSAGRSA